jgi:hypothetical protein
LNVNELEFYLYSGDGQVTVSDRDIGALGGQVTVENGSWGGTKTVAVTLDASIINSLLSGGSNFIGVNIRNPFTDEHDPGWTNTNAPNGDAMLSSQVRISQNSMSLELFYV